MQSAEEAQTYFGLAVLAVVAAGYFLPVLIAGLRAHPSGCGILVLNLFLGWTLIGWVVALAWSLSATRPAVIIQRGG